ncbi:dihydrodipicolinate synthase family protein [Poriferisphaera sp. WC338]|uniref:dihydrodipicolinate synthase family protein n=1 Tax=Poriferisphaera sp. WC338 TaxID=3425129 RepID=UPI003D81585E
MYDIRIANDIHGLWSAVPMPWTQDGKLDEAILERNINRLASIPCDGIYCTDSDGEFYAIELDEFASFVATFTHHMAPHNCSIQIGVTWTNTQGIIDRIKVCLDHGVSAVHICYPYWMPLNKEDVKHFWATLAQAVPSSRWIHYNTPRGHVHMGADEYRWLASEFPEQFIGTKLGTQNFLELSDIIGSTPQIAHMLTDFTVVPGMMLGGRGTYSFWVNTLPDWHRQLLNHCKEQRWPEAMEMQSKFNRWEKACIEPIVGQGYLHGIIGKARGEASGFLEDPGYTRDPYTPVSQPLVEQIKQDFRKWWQEELTHESFAVLKTQS